jgi:hypothetical protein
VQVSEEFRAGFAAAVQVPVSCFTAKAFTEYFKVLQVQSFSCFTELFQDERGTDAKENLLGTDAKQYVNQNNKKGN